MKITRKTINNNDNKHTTSKLMSSSAVKNVLQWNSKWFEPRSLLLFAWFDRLGEGILIRTVVGNIACFNNLSRIPSQVNCISYVHSIHVSSQLTCDVIGCITY